MIDTIHIPGRFYVPRLKLPLLSPQHWAKTAQDNLPVKYGIKIESNEDGCTLLWKQQTRKKWINHDPLTKNPIIQTAPGTLCYQAFEATYMACDASHLREQVQVDLDHLRGHVEQDPAKFSPEEDLLRPEDLKTS